MLLSKGKWNSSKRRPKTDKSPRSRIDRSLVAEDGSIAQVLAKIKKSYGVRKSQEVRCGYDRYTTFAGNVCGVSKT